MKKMITLLVLVVLTVFAVAGCEQTTKIIESSLPNPTIEPRVSSIPVNTDEKLRAFVMFDSGSDPSFIAYDGIDLAADQFGYDFILEYQFDMSEGSVIGNITKNAEAGNEFMLFPGNEFRDAILQSQSIYPDVQFVLLDSSDTDNSNVTSFYFDDYETGFLAGYTAAAEIKEGELGFIGGKAEESQGFVNGFIKGALKANELLDTSVIVPEANILYNDSFFDKENAMVLAGQLYDSGVSVILIATGDAGTGVLTEAKQRFLSGEEAWVIGTGLDIYEQGIYNGKDSVVLTSVIKNYDIAAYIMAEMFVKGALNDLGSVKGTFSNGAVGLPKENPNLSQETIKSISILIDF